MVYLSHQRLINADIRLDRLDSWCLRTELPKYERGVLALGAPPYNDSWLNVVFTRVTREKVRREIVYSFGARYYGCKIEGLTEMAFIDTKTGVLDGNEIIDAYKAEFREIPEDSPC